MQMRKIRIDATKHDPRMARTSTSNDRRCVLRSGSRHSSDATIVTE